MYNKQGSVFFCYCVLFCFLFKDRHQWWGRGFWCSLSLNMDKIFPKAIISIIPLDSKIDRLKSDSVSVDLT